VPDLGSIPVLDVVVGLAFLYFTLSIVCSSVSEIVASVLKLRAKNLETGMRALLGGETAADAFFADWRIASLGTPKRRDRNKVENARTASYLPSPTVALVILDTFAPGLAKESDGPASADAREQLAAKIQQLPNDRARAWLANILAEAEGDVDKARAQLEKSFDDVMDRASGWYKRKVQLILLVVALLVAGGLNADTLNVADRLSRDDAVRAAVVAQAQQAAQAAPAARASPTAAPAATADTVQRQIEAARATALPLGWSPENRSKATVLGVLEKIAGILLTAAALMLGAPFWFDVLGKVARLRSSGKRADPADTPPPAPAAGTPA
jgi:hypothetical protein